MDYQSYNRALLNNRRIERIDDKVMVFIVPSIVQVGVVRTELRFPYKGKILDVYTTCGTVGTSSTVIDIERCTQSDYDGTPTWRSIFSNLVTIDGNKKSNKSSISPYGVNPTQINVEENDHFRINLVQVGSGVKDITVELVIGLEIEEQ